MSKIFDWNAAKGTLIDSVSKTAGTLTKGTGGFKQTQKGQAMEFDGSTTDLSFASSDRLEIEDKDFSVEIYFNPKSVPIGADGAIIGKGATASNQWRIDYRLTTNTLEFVYFSTTASKSSLNNITVLNVNRWYHIILNVDRDGDYNWYLNGVSDGSGVFNDSTSVISSLPLHIGGDVGGGHSYVNANIAKVRLYKNKILNEQERDKAYKEFLHSFPLAKTKRNFHYPKPTDLSNEVGDTFGDDLITNGTFDANVNSWAPLRGTIAWNPGGYGEVTSTDGSGENRFIRQTTIQIVGKRYRVSFDAKSDDVSATCTMGNFGDNTIDIFNPVMNSSWQKYMFEFDATFTELNVVMLAPNINTGDVIAIDNIILEPITGLVAAYNMIPSNGTLVDISGEGNNGTINGAVSTKDGMKFDGDTDEINISDITINSTTSTIALRIKMPDSISTTSSIFNIGNSGAGGGGLKAFFPGNSTTCTFIVAGSVSRNIALMTIPDVAGKEVDMVFTVDFSGNKEIFINGISQGAIDISSLSGQTTGGASTLMSPDTMEGELIDFKVYNYKWSNQKIKDYHNSFAKQVALKDDFTYEGVGNVPREWQEGTGTYELGEYVIEEGELLSGWDFTSGWSAWSGSTNVTSNTFDTDSSGGIFRDNLLTISKTYNIVIEGTQQNAGTFSISTSLKVPYVGLSTTDVDFSMSGTFISETIPLYLLRTGVGSSQINITKLEITEIQPLPTIDTGTKYLDAPGAGTIATQSDTAYGTWEFDLYKGRDTNRYNAHFLTDTIETTADNGYKIELSPTEQLSIKRLNGTLLFSTVDSYINNNTFYRTKIERLSSSGVFKDIPTLQTSNLVNGGTFPYTTFTNASPTGFSITYAGGGTAEAGTVDEIPIVNTAKYLIEFDLTLNSGQTPAIRLRNALGGSSISNQVNSTSGRNSIILTATSTETGVLGFANGAVSDHTISNLSIKRIYDVGTFAVFIKGGSFEKNIWTLVDPTGGSGSNPVTDNTHTTSNYVVLDLDADDRFANLLIKKGVEQ